MEDIWLARAKRLQAIASTGLHYATDDHNRERYAEMAQIAQGMLADVGNVPVRRILDLVPGFAKGYATPFVEVRGAVIEHGRILLVREKADGGWCLPGGFCDVGLSPAENVIKEVSEEAGIDVTARHLFLVRHKAKHAYPPDARDFYKLFFLCDRADTTPPTPGSETMGAAFFTPDDLPDLSTVRTIVDDIGAAFDALANPTAPARFD